MIKFKNLMIAAAALLSVSVPTMAYAGKVGEAFKELRAQKKDYRVQKQLNKLDYLKGDITKEEFKANKKSFIDLVQDTQDSIDELKATR